MLLEGTVQNGVIVLENGQRLPDGTRVEVQVRDEPELSPLAAALLSHAGKAEGLPEDAAAQHDHYLYGTPKR